MEVDSFYWEMVKKNIGVYTTEEQKRLKDGKVIIFGLGGVGGMEAILCARMGIGHVTGVDPDEFEVSNINRQMLATVHSLGKSKAATAEEVLQSINPYISVRCVQANVDEDNVLELMKGHDLVIEAVDDIPSRVIIHRTARELGIPSVGMSGSPPNRGFVSSFFPDGISYETALNIPGAGEKLTNEALRQEIADIKKARAWHSVKEGAPKEWAEDFCEGKAGWIITPVRAHLISLFSFHEAVQILTGREPLARAPKGVLINLDTETPVKVTTPPDGTWNYATL
ncbi:HesA/MoeB/ThiF family protein [Brevibacillus brevis]|uniref:HesA/MoeB/ThiF family protein n=1 Tax=Brevibacillus brevis TaxID=1393 RepID=UPI0025A5DA64|nr:ThiF family adenylyltransferase [Brevibacillus brevis]WJQ82852.1 ThiF family adenylyltransferase [Brevibacillus brevis]